MRIGAVSANRRRTHAQYTHNHTHSQSTHVAYLCVCGNPFSAVVRLASPAKTNFDENFLLFLFKCTRERERQREEEGETQEICAELRTKKMLPGKIRRRMQLKFACAWHLCHTRRMRNTRWQNQCNNPFLPNEKAYRANSQLMPIDRQRCRHGQCLFCFI